VHPTGFSDATLPKQANSQPCIEKNNLQKVKKAAVPRKERHSQARATGQLDRVSCWVGERAQHLRASGQDAGPDPPL
jgi:hypothetical protein